MSIPGQTLGVSAFTNHLIKDLAISRNNLSLAYLIGTIGSALTLSFAGKMLDRIGSRRFGTIVAFALGVILITLSQIDKITQFVSSSINTISSIFITTGLMALGFFLLRFLGQGCLTMVSRNLPMKWFEAKRGLISAIAGMAISLGFSLSPDLLNSCINAFGWRSTWLFSGIFIMFIVSSLYYLIAREQPEDFGLLKDNRKSETDQESVSHKANIATGAKVEEARREFRFWIFVGVITIFSLFATGFTFHVASVFTEAGLEEQDAYKIFLPAAIISAVISLLFSYISDFIKLKYILMLQAFGIILICVSIPFLGTHTEYARKILILGSGIAGGLMYLLLSVTWPRFYGTTHLGSITGLVLAFAVGGSAVGPFMMSMSLDQCGSYAQACWICAMVTAIFFVAAFFTTEKPIQKS